MSFASRAVKSAIARSLKALHPTGLPGSYVQRRLRDKIVVFTYHRVLPAERQYDSFSASSIMVKPSTFERHMRWLSERWRPLTAQEFCELISSGDRPPPGACLVTFDDGWYDNLEYALPVLRDTGVPATLFVATGYIGGNTCFWQERLSRMLYLAWTHRAESSAALDAVGATHLRSVTPESTARTEIRSIISGWKEKTPAEIESLERTLRDHLPSNADACRFGSEDRFLDWHQVRELQADGVFTIGSHATTHIPLTKQPVSSAAEELLTSRRIIGERLGAEPAVFAYPNGDFSDEVVAKVAEAGYRAAFTTVPGYVTRRSHPLRLERINVHEGIGEIPALLARVATVG